MTNTLSGLAAIALALASPAAIGCVLGAVYNLPIPFETYAVSATAALVASFVAVAHLQRVPLEPGGRAGASVLRSGHLHVAPWVSEAASWFSLAALLLSIWTGFIGSANPLANFNMTFFWIVFTLGLAYLTAFVGNVYLWSNPWRAMFQALEGIRPGLFRGVVAYPARLGYYPALALYIALIWIELFGSIRPVTLSTLLLAYTVINLAMTWLFGKAAWLRHGEIFSVFFGLIGRIAPVAYRENQTRSGQFEVILRRPFTGILEGHADHFSLLLFILFMLSSTAFDGAHETLPWVGIFWRGLYPAMSAHFNQPYAVWVHFYYTWQSTMLVVSPFVYLALYLVLLWLAKWVTRSELPLRTLALRFAFTLIPIALVYNVAHYFGELISQGLLIVRMVSDPFNIGWNLFGTARWLADPVVLDAGIVWHMQVAAILVGHIVSVYLAHAEALRVFPTRGRAIFSQLPMLALMVVLTTVGLWILSLPIDAGETAAPPSAMAWTAPTA